MNEIEQKIDDMLVDWEAARLEGRVVSVAELCVNSPELREQVGEKIAVLQQLAWVIDPDQLISNEPSAGAVGGGVDETSLRDTDVTVAEFIRSITESGVLDGSDLARLDECIPPDRSQRAFALAGELVRKQLITPYQAKVILERGEGPLLLDRYVILDSIGCGGMGIVFKALQRSLERVVAVKVLPKHAVDSPEKVERFQREMRAAAKLSHPNVVQAFDAHESNGVFFFAMEYVNGSDLAVLVQERGPLSVEETTSIVAQAAAGLANAHSNGIVHRDVKPGNILLSQDGVAKVLDLGLARTRELAQSTTVNDLTRDGLAMGTVTYMSPEQAFDAKQADEKSDVYSLGCTLYYLLHGKPMFDAPNSIQTVIAHREAPAPELGASRDDVPAALENLFQHMVAKNPQDRPETMQLVRSELLSIVQSNADSSSREANGSSVIGRQTLTSLASLPQNIPRTVGQTQFAPRRWRNYALVGAVALALGCLAFALLRPSPHNSTDETRRAAVSLLQDEEISLVVESADGEFHADYVEELPDAPFNVTGVMYYPEGSANLHQFSGLPDLNSVMILCQDEETQPIGTLAGREKLGPITQLTFDGFELSSEVFTWIGSLKTLVHLDLTGCEFPNDAIATLVRLPQLRRLIVPQTQVGDGELQLLPDCLTLETLDVSNSNVTSQGLKELRKLPVLAELALTGIELDDNIQDLNRLPQLRKLYLDGSNLDDTLIEHIATLPKLELLHAGHTKLSVNGVRRIATIATLREIGLEGLPIQAAVDDIAALPELRVINAGGSDLTDDGLDRLSRAKKLRSLDLANTEATETAIERFMLRSPSCSIYSEASEKDFILDAEFAE